MKRIKEKFKRTVKYWRISYQQANGRDRLSMRMFALLMLAYAWWVIMGSNSQKQVVALALQYYFPDRQKLNGQREIPKVIAWCYWGGPLWTG
jgi:hypothetical protein